MTKSPFSAEHYEQDARDREAIVALRRENPSLTYEQATTLHKRLAAPATMSTARKGGCCACLSSKRAEYVGSGGEVALCTCSCHEARAL